MNGLRPTTGALLVFCTILLLGGLVFAGIADRRDRRVAQLRQMQRVVADLAITDLALSTEARYTRHLAVTDQAVVSMDHPGALDHFPSTLFFAPVH
jgi:hypothetical protein